MLWVLVTALTLLCAALLCYIASLDRGLRSGRDCVEAQLGNETVTRLDIPCPNRAMEELFQSLNGLLELRQREGAAYRQKEEDLRRQIADLSHDLRTPLTSILGYLQLLEEEGLTPEQRGEYLTVIRARAVALQDLITAFYDLSRLEGGAWKLRREPVDLRRVVEDQLAGAYEDLERSGMAPRVDLPDVPTSVWGDEKAVERVVANLLANALAHGVAPMEVRLYQEGRQVRLALTNGAPDLTDQQAQRVFERFYTADASRAAGNSGLGLAIVKGLMERMGGEVSAAVDQGLFTVTLAFCSP